MWAVIASVVGTVVAPVAAEVLGDLHRRGRDHRRQQLGQPGDHRREPSHPETAYQPHP